MATQAAPLSTALIGTWELLSREDRNLAGEVRVEPSLGSDPVALLFFDRKGHFAAQFMKRDRSGSIGADAIGAAGVPNNSRARGGYDAYFGTYVVVNVVTGAVATRLVGALSPENVGQIFVRLMSVTDDELTIRLETASTEGERINRTLRWKRVG